MASLEAEIDRLYRLPLSEFTKARDALAKQFAKEKASIKSLQKPNAAAWAVNQLFWRERRTYDALIAAASKLRAAQVASLKGKSADVAAAEARHAETKRAALDRVRAILSDSGDAASPATMTAAAETLDALPTDDPPGRLVKPLEPMGFEGLAGMLQGATIALRRADVVPFKKKAGESSRTGRDSKAEKEDALREEIRKLTSALREAKDAERAAGEAHARAQKALAAAREERERAVQALDAATNAVGEASRDAAAQEKVAAATAATRERLERELREKSEAR